MADIDRIRENLQQMVDKGAPPEHLNGYLKREGYDSPAAWMAASQAPQTPAAPEATQKPQLEFPDAPTTAKMTLPGTLDKNSLFGLGKYLGFGDDSMPVMDKAAALFGPTLTDNPKARQEIYAKNVPGAEAFDDKFGNPMIRYKGADYYTSRPGEFDAMDAGRLATGVSMSLPAMALAPASALGVAAVGGLTAGGQSLLEDVLANKSGGESQNIDLGKALLATGMGGIAPAVVGKVASAALPAIRGLSAKMTGGLPARATKALTEAGIDVTQLTPKQIEVVAQHGRNRGWNSEEMNTALMKSLGDEFKVPLTSGQLTDIGAQKGLEDQLRHGAYGQTAKTQLAEFGADQNQALNEAAAKARRDVTGSPTKMDPETIGKTLVQEFNVEDTAAKRAVTQAYDDSFDAAKLQAAGAQPAASRADVRNLSPNLDNAFVDQATGVVEQVTPVLNPNTIEGVKFLKQFSETGVLPGAFPNAAPPANMLTGPTDWKTVESARKYINGLRVMAKANPADARSLGMVLDAFDNTFTPGNPLIGTARKLHSERVNLFRPQKKNAVGINSPLEILSNPQNAGMAAYNRIMDGAIKTGEGAPMIAHLQKVFANNPQAMTALKEGMLSRILVNKKTNEVLTAGKARTALQTALTGQEGAAYREIFQGSDLSTMGRFQDLLERIAKTSHAENPSKSGYLPSQLIRKSSAALKGGAAGAVLGALAGMPIPVIGPFLGGAIGTGLGTSMGAAVAAGAGNRAANRAVSGGLPRTVRPRPVGYFANEAAKPVGGVVGDVVDYFTPEEERARGGYLRMRGR